MKTTILGILIMLSYNYCFAQLKVENSTPEPKKEDVYDVSQDLYIRESHRGRYIGAPLDYKSYQKFINQRIFCISDEAFTSDGNRYALKRQFIDLSTPIKGCIQYKKKQLPIVINRIATFLYHPQILSEIPDGSNANLHCFDMSSEKKYDLILFSAFNYALDNVQRKVVNAPIPCAGHFYVIKKILTYDEAFKLLEENPQINPIARTENGHVYDSSANTYYDSFVSGKKFLTLLIQNDILIKNNIDFGGSKDCESPIFLLESESGELFLTRLNEDKFKNAGFSTNTMSTVNAYTTYILENRIEYLKEKFIGKLYKIRHNSDSNEIAKIEDIVIRDNVLSVKYVNVETKDIGYRSMEWNSTGHLWVVAHADEIIPR